MPKSHRRPATNTVTVWNCCYCGSGAMLYSSTPLCTTCDHQRCAYCSVYGAPVTGRGGGGGGTNAPTPTTARDGSSRKGTSIATPKATQEVDSRKETGEPTATGARRGRRDAYVETAGKSNPTAGQISKTEYPEQRESPQGRDLMRPLRRERFTETP